MHIRPLIKVARKPADQQKFKRGELNCFITPIINDQAKRLEVYEQKETIKSKTLKNGTVKQIKIQNKTAIRTRSLIKDLKEFELKVRETGVTIEDIQTVCDMVKASATVYDIMGSEVIRAKYQGKTNYRYEFVNTRTDHVEEFHSSNNQEVIMATEEFNLKISELVKESYMYEISKGTKSRIYHQGITYVESSVKEMANRISTFKSQYPMIYNRYSISQFEYMTQFITANTSFENSEFTG